MQKWGNKHYLSLNYYMREKFGSKVMKIPLDAGFTCPNRDGTKGKGGCLFCSLRGSGDFAGDPAESIEEQFSTGRALMKRKWPEGKYIAYFQAFTNTYAPVDRLRYLYYKALEQPGVVGLAIATRPDCIGPDVLELLNEINQACYLLVELGLQTIHHHTARALNLGYDYETFLDTVDRLRQCEIEVCAHIILGLPGETRKDMLQTGQALAHLPLQGIKIQLLHLMKNTGLLSLYRRGELNFLSMEEYVGLVVDILEMLPPTVVIHRLTGDGPKNQLIGPRWSLDKLKVLHSIDQELERRNSWQGKYYIS